MAHGLTAQLLQSSYVFRVHLWSLWAEIMIQSWDTWLGLKIAEKRVKEEKKKSCSEGMWMFGSCLFFCHQTPWPGAA